MRVFDAAAHNRIANHPLVFPHIAPESAEVIDFTPCAERPEQFALLIDGHNAATCFEATAPGWWEMHIFFLPSCRGRAAIEAATRMVAHMYWVEGAHWIWGKTRVSNRAARWFHRQIGGVSLGVIDDPDFGGMEVFRCSRDEWEARLAK